MEHTGISWTDHTFNIAWGCMKVSPGCKNCYADTLSHRFGHNVWGPPATTPRKTMSASYWHQPIKWNAQAEKLGVRRKVFCSSMCDVFEDHATINAERHKLWPLIRATPNLDWQLLTKRPENIRRFLPEDWCPGDEDDWGYRNVWLGTSVESGEYLHRMWELLEVKTHGPRFLSIEPLLEPFSLGLDIAEDWPEWVIVGGESGPNHREMPLHGLVSLVREAKAGGAAVWVKQDSGNKPGQQGRIPDNYWIQEMPR